MFLQSYSIPVKDIMSEDIFILEEVESIDNAINYLFHNVKKEVIVCDSSFHIKGIITMADVHKLMDKNIVESSLRKAMRKDIIYVNPRESLSNCRNLMLKNKVGRLPVIKEGKVIGIIREEHIRDYFYKGVEESELALKHIFNNIHEGLCVLDSRGRVIIWNRNAEKLYGVKERSIKGKYLKEYFPNAIDLEIFDTKKSVKNVYHSPKEGYHVIISASPIIINEKLYGVVSTEKDISEVEELQNELKKAEERLEVLERQIKRKSKDPFEKIIGNSKKIQEKIAISKQIASSNVSILITGESGTGKEEFAKAIHYYSEVPGEFVPVNCSAIPSELFESEFFGYEKGAFTGARNEGKIGFFEQAKNGTLFLDEIGDLPLPMQAKLLRVLQDKKIRKVGGEKHIPLNVRVISATNKDLSQLIKKDEFREELYYRINVVEIELPPLRERKEDIVLLADYFIKKICAENNKFVPSLDREVMDILLQYEWKGNIRELKNVIDYMVIMSNEETITKEFIPKYIYAENFDDFIEYGGDFLDLNESVSKLEINLINKALEISNGNKAKASKLLNIPRTTLHSKLNKYGID